MLDACCSPFGSFLSNYNFTKRMFVSGWNLGQFCEKSIVNYRIHFQKLFHSLRKILTQSLCLYLMWFVQSLVTQFIHYSQTSNLCQNTKNTFCFVLLCFVCLFGFFFNIMKRSDYDGRFINTHIYEYNIIIFVIIPKASAKQILKV